MICNLFVTIYNKSTENIFKYKVRNGIMGFTCLKHNKISSKKSIEYLRLNMFVIVIDDEAQWGS